MNHKSMALEAGHTAAHLIANAVMVSGAFGAEELLPLHHFEGEVPLALKASSDTSVERGGLQP